MAERGPIYVTVAVHIPAGIDAPKRSAAVFATIDSVLDSDWDPKFLELVICGDTSGAQIERSVGARFDGVVVLPPNTDPNSARSDAAKKSCGDAILFIEAGLTLAPGALDAAIAAFDRSETIVAVGFDILDTDGSQKGRSRWGYDLVAGPVPNPGVAGEVQDILATDIRASLLAAHVLDRAGSLSSLAGIAGDVDLGWFLAAMGYRSVVVGGATVLVDVSAAGTLEDDSTVSLTERIEILYKNADTDLLRAALPLLADGDGSTAGQQAETLDPERTRRSELRRRADFELASIFGSAIGSVASTALGRATGAAAIMGSGRKIVVATADSLAVQMAGPAIRSWKIAEALSAEHEVRVLANKASVESDDFQILIGNDKNYRDAIEWCDIFIFQGWILAGRPYIEESNKVLIADIYDPMHLEQLEQAADGGSEFRRKAVEDTVGTLNSQLLRADFTVCASEEQRSFWLGQLAALGRINPETYDHDPTLRTLIDVVPFGISEEPPQQTRAGIRDQFDAIGPDDLVILWGGGVYNWFDPLTLVRAIDELRVEFPTVRLVFMGMAHPNPDVPRMRMAADTEALSEELGLTGTHVFFNRSWVDYSERHNFLCDADIGVATHFPGVETDFAFRTRILDYLWAGLPTVTTEGGTLPDLVTNNGAGLSVPAEDVTALSQALAGLLADPQRRAAMSAAAVELGQRFRWSSALEPILEFCRAPRRAPDLLNPVITDSLKRELAPPKLARKGPIRRIMVVLKVLDDGGWRAFADRIVVVASQFLRKIRPSR